MSSATVGPRFEPQTFDSEANTLATMLRGQNDRLTHLGMQDSAGNSKPAEQGLVEYLFHNIWLPKQNNVTKVSKLPHHCFPSINKKPLQSILNEYCMQHILGLQMIRKGLSNTYVEFRIFLRRLVHTI